MKGSQKKIVIYAVCLVLAVFTFSLPAAAVKEASDITQLASFKAFEGDIKVSQGRIQVQLGLTEFIDKNGREKLRQKYPDWKGESHRGYNYQWQQEEKKYTFVNEEFVNGSSQRVLTAVKNGKQPVKVEASKPWSEFIPTKSVVKAYQEKDLTGDGQQEIVLFLRDKKEKSVIHKPAQLLILKPANDQYEPYKVVSEFRSRRYENWASCTGLIKLDVAEINGDGVQEIMVWSYSLGGSGYTTTLDIYAPERGQKSINVNK